MLFAVLFVDLDFSFLLLNYFKYLSVEAFVRESWPKFMLVKKLIFHHSRIFFPTAEFLHLNYMQRVKVSKIITLQLLRKFIFRSELIRQMNSGSYSIDTIQLNPVLIRLFDPNKEKVSVQLLDMGACKNGTIEALFNSIDSILKENKINWENCVPVGLDSTVVV